MNTAAARKRIYSGFGTFSSLLSIGTDPKTAKSNALGEYWTAILYLAPGNLSGHQTCPKATAGCLASCLHTAGNPVYFQGKNRARIAKTRFLFASRSLFIDCLKAEIASFRDKCIAKGLKACIRLNGTSDIVWEKLAPSIFADFPDVQFYDYTKIGQRLMPAWGLPSNYRLTLSRSESNETEVLRILAANPSANVAVVFGGSVGISAHPKALPATWYGRQVIDADKHDLRFIDPAGTIAGLRAKGNARKDASGFVVMV